MATSTKNLHYYIRHLTTAQLTPQKYHGVTSSERGSTLENAEMLQFSGLGQRYQYVQTTRGQTTMKFI